jgi:hypothetical protein
MLCYDIYFSSGWPSAPKVPYWSTGRAELEMYKGERGEAGCECVLGHSRLIARADLSKEIAGFRQFGELGEVSSYC